MTNYNVWGHRELVEELQKRDSKEHITKREIFDRIRAIREKYQGIEPDTEELELLLMDLETAVLQDCRTN